MKKLLTAASLAAVVLLCSVSAQCRTLSFDDVPSGTALYYSTMYRDTYRVRFDPYFAVVDHTESTWGPALSEPNVAICSSYSEGYDPRVFFGYATPAYADFDDVRSVRAFFSTAKDAVVRVTAYRVNEPNPVAAVIIGAAGESWNNVPVEIGSGTGLFTHLWFHGVSSQSALLGFCMDDMTITYVPEPSSLLALCAGIGVMGTGIRRRRG